MSNPVIIASVSVLVAFLMACAGIYKRLDLRKNELRWKRIEFIFEQAKHMDCDVQINRSLLTLDGGD